jgi:hypothetical protein
VRDGQWCVHPFSSENKGKGDYNTFFVVVVVDAVCCRFLGIIAD